MMKKIPCKPRSGKKWNQFTYGIVTGRFTMFYFLSFLREEESKRQMGLDLPDKSQNLIHTTW